MRTSAGARPGELLFGYQSLLVPTFVRGTQVAFEQFGSGRIGWQHLLEPAIRYAEAGFTIYPYLHQSWRADAPVLQTAAPFDGYRMLTKTPACAAIFTREGRVPRIGERLVQPDLARTLRRLAVEGPEDFYTGETGRAMAADLERHGSPVTARDLADCRAEVREPLRGSYRGLAVSTDPPPAIGGLLLELLNILECHDLRALGHGSAAYYDLLARALYLVFADRTRFAEAGAGPALFAELTSKSHARELSRRIGSAPRQPAQPPSNLAGTTHVTTYDDEGSAVSMTHTICFGSGVVTRGLGFMHNSGMCMFDPRPGEPNSIAPGKRPIAGGGPAILFDGDAVRLVLGSPHGGRKTSSMAHVLMGVLELGLSPPRRWPVHAFTARTIHASSAWTRSFHWRLAASSRDWATECAKIPTAAACVSWRWIRRRALPAVPPIQEAAAASSNCRRHERTRDAGSARC